ALSRPTCVCGFLLPFLAFLLHVHAPPRDLHSFPTRRSSDLLRRDDEGRGESYAEILARAGLDEVEGSGAGMPDPAANEHYAMHRSEEHTSELQSHLNLVCRLLLEKKKKKLQNLHRMTMQTHN